MADSSDLWDIARSVIMVGTTREKGIRYASQEKCNYGLLAPTVLFSLDDEKVRARGTTEKKDRDFVLAETGEASRNRTAPARDAAAEIILDTLSSGPVEMTELDGLVKAAGASPNALRNAKAQLRKEGKIRIRSVGFGKDKKYFASAVPENGSG